MGRGRQQNDSPLAGGQVTYEQDFLTNSYESIADLQGRVGLAKAWLAAMSDAADETNVTLQVSHSLQLQSLWRIPTAAVG